MGTVIRLLIIIILILLGIAFPLLWPFVFVGIGIVFIDIVLGGIGKVIRGSKSKEEFNKEQIDEIKEFAKSEAGFFKDLAKSIINPKKIN